MAEGRNRKISLNGCVMSNNAIDGLAVHGDGDVEVVGGHYINNGRDGISFRGSGNFSAERINAAGNGREGIRISNRAETAEASLKAINDSDLSEKIKAAISEEIIALRDSTGLQNPVPKFDRILSLLADYTTIQNAIMPYLTALVSSSLR